MAEDARSQREEANGVTSRRSLLAGLGALLAWPGRMRPVSAQGKGSSTGGGGQLKIKGVRKIPVDLPPVPEVMAWAPDSRRIAVAQALAQPMSVWDARTGKRMPGPGERLGVSVMAYSPDGRYLAIDLGMSPGPPPPGRSRPSTGPYATDRASTSLWDATTGAWLQNLTDEAKDIPSLGSSSLVFTPDSRYLAVAHKALLAFYSQEDGIWRRTGGLFPVPLGEIAASPDSTKVAVASSKSGERANVREVSLKIIDVPSGRLHADWIIFKPVEFRLWERVAFRPDGREIAIGYGTQLAVVDAGDGRILRATEVQPPSGVRWLSYSPDGRHLAVASRDLFIFDTGSLDLVVKLTDHGQAIAEAGFSQDGSMLAAVAGKAITIWDLVS